jgi:hypothetical protein
MNTLRTTLGMTVLLAASAAAGLAAAHDLDPAVAKLPKEIQPMHCLVGTWQGSATFTQGAQKSPVKFNIRCEAASAGYGISCKASFTGFPSGAAEETDLFGYDSSKRQYHWYAVTNQGETHDHVAELPKSNTIDFVYRGQQDGKPFVESIALTISKDGKRMDFATDGSLDNQPIFSLHGGGNKQ